MIVKMTRRPTFNYSRSTMLNVSLLHYYVPACKNNCIIIVLFYSWPLHFFSASSVLPDFLKSITYPLSTFKRQFKTFLFFVLLYSIPSAFDVIFTDNAM